MPRKGRTGVWVLVWTGGKKEHKRGFLGWCRVKSNVYLKHGNMNGCQKRCDSYKPFSGLTSRANSYLAIHWSYTSKTQYVRNLLLNLKSISRPWLFLETGSRSCAMKSVSLSLWKQHSCHNHPAAETTPMVDASGVVTILIIIKDLCKQRKQETVRLLFSRWVVKH